MAARNQHPWEVRIRRWIQIGGPFFGLLVVCLLLSFSEARAFIFSAGNLKTILIQTVIVAIGALGMTQIIISGGIDLSVGSVVAFTSVLGAKLVAAGHPPLLVGLGAILAGGGIGLVNGGLVAGLRLSPFIVTLGMLGVVRGSAKWLGDNQTVNIPPDSSINHIMARHEPREFFPLPPGVWVAIVLAVFMALILRYSVFGRHVFAIGSNEATARLCGVRIGRSKLLLYGFSGLFFGLAGLFQLSRLTQGDPTVAVGLELDIIAAVVIGGASLSGGAGSILGSMVGALMMAVLRNGTQLIDWPNYVQDIIIGMVIVLAVALDKWRQSRRS
jgi:ribose transport system permease protein